MLDMRTLLNKLSGRPNTPHWWHTGYFRLSVAAAIVGLVLSTSAWFAVSHREDQLSALELSSRAEGHALNLQVGIISYLRKAAAVRALFDSSDAKVSRTQFEDFTKLVMNDQHAILGISWLPRIMHDQRISHERAAVLDGIADYQIKSVAPDGSLAASPEKSDYFPVFYNVTEASRTSAYGLDVSDGSMRQKTFERARDNDNIAASPIFTLQTGTGHRRGFIVALPVYTRGLPHTTLEERQRNLQGYISVMFQTSVMVESILSTTRQAGGLDLYFYSADSNHDTSELVYFHGSRSRAVAIEPEPRFALSAGPHWTSALRVGDARWTMIAVPIPGGPGTIVRSGAWMALFFGFFVTAIVVAYIWSTGRYGRRLQVANGQLDQTLGALNTVNDELSAALNNMVQGFIMFDSRHRIAVFNDRYIEMYRLSPDIVKPGLPFLELLHHRAALGIKVDPQRSHDEVLADIAKGEVTKLIIDAGDGREILINNKPMPGGGWVATHEDVTERRRAEAKISHMALHDGLTGLVNRHLFNDELTDCFDHMARGQQFALLCLDLDRFKNVNDTLGHPLGDKLLQQVAARLRLCVREYDTVARLGGDEFAILQRNEPEPAAATSLSKRIVAALGRPFDLDGHQVLIGVSIGIALAPTDATDSVELLKAADLALLRVKVDGRGSYRFFDTDLDGRIQERHSLERDLRKALLDDEFVMHYQPLVNLQSGQISAFEALVRWNHPERGLIPPADFISFAEETGLIVPIGEWALRQACKEAAKWPGSLSVAVNLSPIQFKERDICQTVTDALVRSGLPPDRLELEITESALLRNQVSTLEKMRQLRELGIRVAIDDFGTGYSSLSSLINFPFDKIKIDRSFVHNLLSKSDSRAIIQAVVQLANSLGLQTTAEGVESQGEVDYLKRVGCTEAQGYLFGKAVPPKDINSLLNRQAAQAKALAA
jgi:diguanylate cyclase (GGDEF)-like protein